MQRLLTHFNEHCINQNFIQVAVSYSHSEIARNKYSKVSECSAHEQNVINNTSIFYARFAKTQTSICLARLPHCQSQVVEREIAKRRNKPIN